MSDSFQSALEKVNFGKYIDQIQDELRRAIAEVGPGKTPGEVEAIQSRLQALLRKQSKEIAKEVGFAGNQAIVFMIATSIISTAWVSFALRRETLDLSKSPEDRLATMEMFDALDLALGNVVRAGSEYADTYTEKTAGPVHAEGTGKKESK
jgi:ATP phosphoribosyltransferase regulatory subunit HisZ